MNPIVRVSIPRRPADKFAARPKTTAEPEAAPGLAACHAGRGEATSSLHNTSAWDTLDHAKQMDTFQPMLDSAKRFAAFGVTFERPIMNYATLWQTAGTAARDGGPGS